MQQSTAVIILCIYTFGVVYKMYKCMCFMIKLGRHLRYTRDTETCFELVFPHFVNFVFLLYWRFPVQVQVHRKYSNSLSSVFHLTDVAFSLVCDWLNKNGLLLLNCSWVWNRYRSRFTSINNHSDITLSYVHFLQFLTISATTVLLRIHCINYSILQPQWFSTADRNWFKTTSSRCCAGNNTWRVSLQAESVARNR